LDRYRVLLVEDEPIVARDMVRKLQKLGHEVVACAATGAAAVAQARQAAPDIVLMDIELAGPLDGIEAARRVREFARIPLVYLTAHGEGNALERAKSTMPDGYVLKPASDQALQVAMELAVHRYSAEHARERLGARGGPKHLSSSWHCNPSRTVLTTPNGVRVALTAHEGLLLGAMLSTPGENVPRETLFRALDYPDDVFGHQRLDALVSRLRAKVRSADPAADFPLRSRRLLGYVFVTEKPLRG
jgi:DNA-binding response OmpR family regulator